MYTIKYYFRHRTTFRIFRRRDTYYLLYADNQTGPHSPCTAAIYHACIAYGTASSPMGPWTYQGVILDPVSSTTSHSGVVEFKGKWYIVYHTADAKGGGDFRRSVAIDGQRYAGVAVQEWEALAPKLVTPSALRKLAPTSGVKLECTAPASP